MNLAPMDPASLLLSIATVVVLVALLPSLIARILGIRTLARNGSRPAAIAEAVLVALCAPIARYLIIPSVHRPDVISYVPMIVWGLLSVSRLYNKWKRVLAMNRPVNELSYEG